MQPMGSPHYADIALDILPLFDCYLRDLGLPANRRGCADAHSTEADGPSWLDGVQPYSKLDYRGVIDEWQRSRQGSTNGKWIE